MLNRSRSSDADLRMNLPVAYAPGKQKLGSIAEIVETDTVSNALFKYG
ncbi:MAG: hypothetical protein RL346_1008 [Verrucomicrobiota bacterium]